MLSSYRLHYTPVAFQVPVGVCHIFCFGCPLRHGQFSWFWEQAFWPTHISAAARNSSPFPLLFLASYFNLPTSWPAPSPSLPCVCARPLSSVRQDQPHIQPCNPKLIHTASRPPSCGTFPGRLPSHSRGLAAQTVCNHFVLQPLTQR